MKIVFNMGYIIFDNDWFERTRDIFIAECNLVMYSTHVLFNNFFPSLNATMIASQYLFFCLSFIL